MKNDHDENNGCDEERWEQVCDELQHHHKQQLDRHAQHADHNAQQVHLWRRSHQRLRGAYRAMSVHIERTDPHLWWHRTPHWLKSWALSHSIHGHIHGRTLLDSTSPFFLYSSFFLSPSPSSTTSCSLSSTTRSSWQVCAIPLQMRVRTPWTCSTLWAQPPDLRQTQRLISPLILSSDQGRGWRDTWQGAHRGTPRTSRLLRTRRHVSQSVVVIYNVR